MPIVEPYDRARLENLVSSRTSTWFKRNDDMVYMAQFSNVEPELEVRWAHGSDESILEMKIFTPKCVFSVEEGPAILALINRWHRMKRWPKVVLQPYGEKHARVVCETHYLLTDGIHEELLATFCDLAVTVSKDLFLWLLGEYKPTLGQPIDLSDLEKRFESDEVQPRTEPSTDNP